jgi:hypothetical protein
MSLGDPAPIPESNLWNYLRKILTVAFLIGISEGATILLAGWPIAIGLLVLLGMIGLIIGSSIVVFEIAYWLWTGDTP